MSACIWCENEGKGATLQNVYDLIVEALADGSPTVLAETMHMIEKPLIAMLLQGTSGEGGSI